MTGTRKSGKVQNAKGAGRKGTPRAQPAKSRKRPSEAVGTARQQEKDRWRELVESSAAWIWETDASIRHIYTNAFVTRCLGYRPAEFLSLNTLDLVHPDDRGLVKALVQNAISRKEGWFDQVLRWRHKDGSWRHIESSGSALFDEQGTFTGLSGVDRDITEQKRAAEDLRRSEEKYRGLFENAIDAICIVDRNQNYLDVNRRAIELFGYSREELLSMNVRDILPPGQLPRSEQEFAKLNESGAYEKFTGKVRKKDGSTIDVEVSSSVIVEQGQVVGSRDIIRDITDRRQAETLLRDSENRMRSIVEFSPVGMHMYRLEPDGRLVFTGANPAADRILGVDNRIFIGKTIEEAFPLLKETEVPQRYRDVARSGKSWQTESVEYQDNAIKGAFEVHAFQTAPNTMVAAFEDITARKQSESALKQSEEKYRRLYNETPVLLHSIDRDARLVEVNDHWLQTLGYERNEVIGRKVTDFYTEASRKYAQEVVQPAFFRDGMVNNVSYQFVKTNGDVVDVLLSATGERDAAGNVVRSRAVILDITERKRAEDALRKSEKMLQTIIDAEPECVKLLDENASLIMMNRAGLDMLQVDSLDQVKGQCVCPMVTSEYRQQFLDLTRRVFQGESGTLLFEMVGVKGRHLWLETHAVPLRNEKDEIVALLGVTRDITERKRAEEETDRLIRAVSIVTEGIAMTDEQDRFIYLNEAHAKTYGYLQSELMGKSWRDVTPHELVPLIEQELPRTLRNRETGVWSGEAPGLCKDGTRIATEITATARWNEKGEYLGHICVVRDITERKRIDEALRASEARFRSIIEHASSGILVADIGTKRFVYANSEICRMLGYHPDELLGLEVSSIHPAAELARVQRAFAASQGIQTFCLRKDGTAFPVEIRSVAMELDGRQCLAGFFTDITERHLLEEERLKAQKLESIGTLAGGIAHDFNNLLQGVFGYISMAKLTIDQREKSLAMLVQAEQALHRSVSLTSQLLTFSKGGKPVKKAVDLRPVIQNAVTFALSGSPVSYDLSFGEDLCGVEADEGQIGQVVQNIVLNAEQSMPLGGRIDIEARNVPAARAAGLPLSAPDGLVEIVIRDRGTGIPAGHLPRIFDPYFTTKEKGSGLGLATSYSIVKNHDGMIDVASVLGKGSTFTVYLPATGAAKVQAASSASAERAAGRTGRVLVMDDEQVVRVVAGELLRELGHKSEFAEHGDSAIEKYRQAKAEGSPFEVVILDLTIRGGMGGMETLRKLKEIDPGVKAVVSSGYSDDEIIATYRQNGFQGFLKKPYSIAELRMVLDEVMA